MRRIDDLATARSSLSDSQLRKESLALRHRALSGEPLDSMIPEAYSLVREASHRALNLRHYDVQLLAGIALHFRRVAVMQTGEGKTLTATAPMYLAALLGKGVHLVTANDYLAQRDAEQMQPMFERLGLTVGAVTADTPRSRRSAAYRCDITYSTAKEIGFDFLRDRLLHRQQELGLVNRFSHLITDRDEGVEQQPVQRGMHFALVDEADNILIDEARTPLVVSSLGPAGDSERLPLFQWASGIAPRLIEVDHYEIDMTSRTIHLTPEGRALVRRHAATPELSPFPAIDVHEQVELAILVARFYQRDRHYIIRDGEVIIVDEFTGRLAEGRKWRAGLHQAIEAKEKVEITGETRDAARITIQDLFRKYERLAGMTGTVGNSSAELQTIYETPVMEIPTHRPSRRVAWPNRIFATEQQKWLAIVDEVESLHGEGRPVLIGTRSIDKSLLLSELLTSRNIPHQVLNAKQHAAEAEIVERAGGIRQVTVATNMAGRGTDIKLDPATMELGGLHIICSELHESARIDRQLIGRCGRQGDPGTYRQFMSLEDELLEKGLSPRILKQLHALKGRSSSALGHVERWFIAAQRHLEQKNFRGRKILMFHESHRQDMQREMGLDPYLDAPAS